MTRQTYLPIPHGDPPAGAALELARIDPELEPLIRRVGPYALRQEPDAWTALASAVLYQQIAGSAAKTICSRLRDAHAGQFPTAPQLLASPAGSLRNFGVSPRKEATLRNLAIQIDLNQLALGGLTEEYDETIMAELSSHPGVGPWTAQMFLIFHLGRRDVFMPGDLGLRKAIAMQRGMTVPPTPSECSAIAQRWAPCRTVASWYLWRSVPGFPEPGF